ncbi:hypothetical protein [Paenibacillus lautus]|uniref:hypothetical protein n=1 Tax=Paenibacillus lautus TaxID=1401 RepID=UPI003D2E4EE3
MTALNWILGKDRLIITSDTLSLYASDRTPKRYMTKMYILPHLKMVLAGTGNAEVIIEYQHLLFSKVVARSILHIVDTATTVLKTLYNQHSEAGTVTIYLFGLNEKSQENEGYALRSENDFIPEKLNYDICYAKPHLPNNLVKDLYDSSSTDDEFFIKLIKEQRTNDLQLPKVERLGIGGEIQRIVMDQNDFLFSTIFKFDDFETNFQAMLENMK